MSKGMQIECSCIKFVQKNKIKSTETTVSMRVNSLGLLGNSGYPYNNRWVTTYRDGVELGSLSEDRIVSKIIFFPENKFRMMF